MERWIEKTITLDTCVRCYFSGLFSQGERIRSTGKDGIESFRRHEKFQCPTDAVHVMTLLPRTVVDVSEALLVQSLVNLLQLNKEIQQNEEEKKEPSHQDNNKVTPKT